MSIRKLLVLAMFLSLALPWASAPQFAMADVKVPAPKAGVEMPKFLTTQGGVGAGAPLDVTLETLLKGVRKAYPQISIRTIPGGSKDCIDRIIAGEIDIGATVPTFPYDVWFGKGAFKEANTKDVRLLYNVDTGNKMTWVVNANSDIHSVKDLDGKRIHASSAGTSTNLIAIPAILAVHGMSYDTIKGKGGFVYTGSLRGALDMMAAGQLDAAFTIEPSPAPSLVQYALMRKVRLIPFTPEEQAVAGKIIGWYGSLVPAGSYKWLDKDVPSVTSCLTLVINAKLGKDVVYNLLSAGFSEYKKWGEIHPALSYIDGRDTALKFHEIPLHPGAQEFLKDFGLKVGKSVAEK